MKELNENSTNEYTHFYKLLIYTGYNLVKYYEEYIFKYFRDDAQLSSQSTAHLK